MAFSYSPEIVLDGLVLYLDAANVKSYPGTGTTWNDLTINQNIGTLTNGPGFSSENFGAITFDGVNDFASIPNSTATQFPNTSAWSFSLTAKLLSQNNQYPGIFSKGIADVGSPGILLFYSNSGSVVLKQSSSQPTNVSVTMNREFNYTVTHNGSGTTRVYLNGAYRNNGPTISSVDTSNNLQLGNGDFYGNVRIYNFIKYNRQLTDNEVLQNYNATKTRFNLT